MSTYDEIEIEDMTFEPENQMFTYPCPCGDRFQIYLDDMFEGEKVAVCPSCSLMIDVVFDKKKTWLSTTKRQASTPLSLLPLLPKDERLDREYK